jgi:DNA (cytosine-5)-methyltransferase 1
VTAYYNEIDPYAAQWLRNLIDNGHIAPGVVDERSIEDVRPDEIMGYTQCHFFAGIGVWSLALRRAGWPDNRPVWTGSCPCQPFSTAGAQAGFEDARHLWPSLAWLIKQCGPSAVIGEQVASKSVEPWIDLVQVDLEALDYAFGCVPFPSAGVGAPHIRDRAYWVANSPTPSRLRPERRDNSGAYRRGLGPLSELGRFKQHGSFNKDRGNSDATNGFWQDSDWLFCRDGKWRAVEPGTFPLADGAANRLGRLRAYGNAINAEAATVFIRSVMQAIEKPTTTR